VTSVSCRSRADISENLPRPDPVSFRGVLGLDDDPRTIATVNAPGPISLFRAVAVSMGNVFRGEYRIPGTFDLIYSAGLFDTCQTLQLYVVAVPSSSAH
jgi:hypothetical protein